MCFECRFAKIYRKTAVKGRILALRGGFTKGRGGKQFNRLPLVFAEKID